MVLKRLTVATLGALGLGALLAIGPASAQIPVPDDLKAPETTTPPTEGCTLMGTLVDGRISLTDGDCTADQQMRVSDARSADANVIAAQDLVTSTQNALEILPDDATSTQIAVAGDSPIAEAALAELAAERAVFRIHHVQSDARCANAGCDG